MRIVDNGKSIRCQIGICQEKIPNTKWGKIKQGEKWFFSYSNDEAYCPEHIPRWVPEWREWRGFPDK